MKRDLVSFALWNREDLEDVFRLTRGLQAPDAAGWRPLEGRTAALVFEKASLRTRASFEAGLVQLGGHPLFLQQETIGISTRESVHDIGRILSEYCALIVARTLRHQTCAQLADSATVPVINAMTDLVHPCQILADVHTLMERGRFTHATRVVFLGDGNNIVNSWLELAAKIPMHLVCACPSGYEPHPGLLEEAQSNGVSRVEMIGDPVEAVRDADVVYTDVWPQSGPGVDEGRRVKVFRPYQVNRALLKHARKDCLVMHRLPANRGEEITSDILDSPRSVVHQQARNRLHVQKGVILRLLKLTR
jgi:ornithine carbamoyltransferase